MMTRNNEYWNKRLSTVYDVHKRSVKIDNLYRKSYARMYKEIEKLYSECGERELTRTELYRYAKFLSFKNKLRDERGIMGTALDAQLEKALTGVYKDAGLAAKERLGKTSEWTVLNEKMAQSCVERKWAGSHFSTRIWKDTDKLAKRVENGVVDCIVGGKNQNELRKMLRGEFGVSRRQADCLVRTEVAHALNSGQIETYKSEGLKELEFDCEASACDKCLEIARGNPYPIDKLPCVICHPNCRCTWIPVVDLAAAADNIIKRIDNSGENDIIKEDKDSNKSITNITNTAINNVKRVDIDGLTSEQCDFIQEQHKDLLKYAHDKNDSKEAAFVFNSAMEKVGEYKGTADSLEFGYIGGSDLLVMHNHPRNGSYSTTDIQFFISDDNVKTLTIVKNNGEVEILSKGEKYNCNILTLEYERLKKKIIKNSTKAEYDKFVKTLLTKTKSGVIWSGNR